MIGFDIGTTQSKVAYVDPAGKAVTIFNTRKEPQTPSAVYYSPSGEIIVGTEAIEQGYISPERCARNFKLKLGTTESLIPGGPVITPTDATAEIIRFLKEIAERHLAMAISEAVATCPANTKDDFKQALIEAFERNGIKILKLVSEPTAAGLAYTCDKAASAMTVAVYDFGGGTFDISILKVEGSEITVLATEGVHKLGGNDLNACLHRRVLDAFEAKFNIKPTIQTEPLLYLELDQRVERAKISLNTRTEVPVVLGYQGKHLICPITQAEFHADITPLAKQSLDAVDKAVKAAGLSTSQIDRLIMVGGTSNVRFIQEAVASHTGLMPRADIDPIMAVAYGAALASVLEMAKQGRTATLKGQVIPSPEVFVCDVTAHPVGCCVVDNSGAKKRLSNSVIIPKNTPIPCHKTDQYYLEHDDQTEARIEILQGEADAERDTCLVIGELTLKNMPKEIKRTPRIQVEYMINSSGMVTATATDKVSGQQQTVSVDYKKGIMPRPRPSSI